MKGKGRLKIQVGMPINHLPVFRRPFDMNGDLRARIFYERSDGLGCNLTGLLAFGLCGNEWLQFVRSEIYGHVGKRSSEN